MDNPVQFQVTFQGPYSFLKSNDLPSILESPLKDGIYIWTVPVSKGELIYYVGITTRTFNKRMMEHLKGYLSGEYGINEPVELRKGKRVRVWDGFWRGADIEDFIKRHKEFYPKLFDLLKLYKIYVAPVDYEPRLLERIEAAIVKHLCGQGGIASDFQETDIRYRGLRNDENPVSVKLACSNDKVNLPSILEV